MGGHKIELSKEEIRIVIDLLRYIQKYPNAKHTKEGIAKQWLVQQRLEEEMDKVANAISYLEIEEFIQIIKDDACVYFRVNGDKRDQIQSMIHALAQEIAASQEN